MHISFIAIILRLTESLIFFLSFRESPYSPLYCLPKSASHFAQPFYLSTSRFLFTATVKERKKGVAPVSFHGVALLPLLLVLLHIVVPCRSQCFFFLLVIMASAFRRFFGGAAVGFIAAPVVQGISFVLCDTPPLAPDLASVVGAWGPLRGKEALLPPKNACDPTWGTQWEKDWDHPVKRGIVEDRSSRHVRQIILIRHGQYENESLDDDSIRVLTPLGIEQARETGQYLRRMFEASAEKKKMVAQYRDARRAYKNAVKRGAPATELQDLEEKKKKADVAACSCGGMMVDGEPRLIHVSDMTRAKQTLQYILEAFPDKMQDRQDVDAALRERFPCDPQPPHSRVAKEADIQKAEEVFERYFHRPSTDDSTVEIIVGHANVIRYLTMRALQLPPEAWLRMSLPHCSVTSLSISGNGRVKLIGCGSYGHLPPELVTISNIS